MTEHSKIVSRIPCGFVLEKDISETNLVADSQCRGDCPGSKSSSPMRNSLSTVLVVKKRNGIGDDFLPRQMSVFSIPWILDMDFFRSVCTLNTSILVKGFKRS